MNLNLTAAPPIQGPTQHALAELARRIESDATEGPCFMWDRAAELYITAIVHRGVIVNWQIDPARTKAEADALRDRSLQQATMAAMAIAGTLPNELRDELMFVLNRGLGRGGAEEVTSRPTAAIRELRPSAALREPTGSEAIPLAENFGDPESLLNSRAWLESALEKHGAKITGMGCGFGQSDIDILLEGHRFNVSIRPIL